MIRRAFIVAAASMFAGWTAAASGVPFIVAGAVGAAAGFAVGYSAVPRGDR